MVLFPETRFEAFLAKIAGESGPDLEPITRTEAFLDDIAGAGHDLEPRTRFEYWLQKIAENAGGGEWTTDGIAEQTEPNGALTTRATVIKSYAFYGCPVTDLVAPNATIFEKNCLDKTLMTDLTDRNYPLNDGHVVFSPGTQFTHIKLTGAVILSDGSGPFRNTALITAEFPNAEGVIAGFGFGDSQHLERVDLGKITNIGANGFYNCHALSKVILRSPTLCTLGNVSAFAGTPLRGYNSLSGTVYVPAALIESYKVAANWSTIYNDGHCTFASIEGSEYAL